MVCVWCEPGFSFLVTNVKVKLTNLNDQQLSLLSLRTVSLSGFCVSNEPFLARPQLNNTR